MSMSLTGRTPRWVAALLDHIEHGRVYETAGFDSFLDHDGATVDVSRRTDWLYAQTPALAVPGDWHGPTGQVRRLWVLTGDGRLALAAALVRDGAQ